jgi:hypothetical protein
MNRLLASGLVAVLAIAVATPALALDSGNRTSAQPAASDEETGAIDRATLAKGENSFTESQARSRLESAGFTHVGALVLDEQGIWRGTADKGAMTIDVGLDFKGRIAADNARAR